MTFDGLVWLAVNYVVEFLWLYCWSGWPLRKCSGFCQLTVQSGCSLKWFLFWRDWMLTVNTTLFFSQGKFRTKNGMFSKLELCEVVKWSEKLKPRTEGSTVSALNRCLWFVCADKAQASVWNVHIKFQLRQFLDILLDQTFLLRSPFHFLGWIAHTTNT